MLEQFLVFWTYGGESGVAQVEARDEDEARAKVLGAYRVEKK